MLVNGVLVFLCGLAVNLADAAWYNRYLHSSYPIQRIGGVRCPPLPIKPRQRETCEWKEVKNNLGCVVRWKCREIDARPRPCPQAPAKPTKGDSCNWLAMRDKRGCIIDYECEPKLPQRCPRTPVRPRNSRRCKWTAVRNVKGCVVDFECEPIQNPPRVTNFNVRPRYFAPLPPPPPPPPPPPFRFNNYYRPRGFSGFGSHPAPPPPRPFLPPPRPLPHNNGWGGVGSPAPPPPPPQQPQFNRFAVQRNFDPEPFNPAPFAAEPFNTHFRPPPVDARAHFPLPRGPFSNAPRLPPPAPLPFPVRRDTSSAAEAAGAINSDVKDNIALDYLDDSERIPTRPPHLSTSRTSQVQSRSGCVDTDSECKYWASIGECSKNPEFMADKCKKSCSTCNTIATTRKQRPTTLSSRRNRNRRCKDKDSECKYWAEIGECAENPNFMLATCRKSCGKCPKRRRWISRAERLRSIKNQRRRLNRKRRT